MKLPILSCLILAAAVAGCGEKSGSTTPSTNAPTNGGSVLTAPVDYLSSVTRAQQSAVKTVDTVAINQAIQLFQVDRGRLPKDLNELVQEKFLPQIPATPYGTKLSYDPQSGQVKVVKE